MSFAALIAPLVISGSRKSDGEANASGLCFFYRPGTLTPVSVYSDASASAVVSAPLVLDNGGRVNYDDYPEGIYATQPVRLLIQDTDGNTVSDTTFIPATAGNVGVDNDGFPDATTLDQVLDEAYASTGGTAFNYLESGGATERSIQDKFREQGISVADFGAVGDGIADDTSAIQRAIDRAISLGGAVVRLSPGTYKTSSTITMTDAFGVFVEGAGVGSTFIRPTNALTNGFTLDTCASCGFSGFTLWPTIDSAGTAVAATDSTLTFDRVQLYGGFGGDYETALSLVDTGVSFTNGTIIADTFGVLISGTTSVGSSFVGNAIGAASVCFRFDGNGTNFIVANNVITTAGAALAAQASFAGSGFRVYGNTITATNGFAFTSTPTDPDLRQWGNGIDGYTVNVTTGGSVAPNRYRGNQIRIRGTTTGSAYTVGAPTPVPTASMRAVFLYLTFYNNAGGAVTGWTMDASYHLSAGPSTVDGQLTSYVLLWDPDASVWREFSRSVTT